MTRWRTGGIVGHHAPLSLVFRGECKSSLRRYCRVMRTIKSHLSRGIQARATSSGVYFARRCAIPRRCFVCDCPRLLRRLSRTLTRAMATRKTNARRTGAREGLSRPALVAVASLGVVLLGALAVQLSLQPLTLSRNKVTAPAPSTSSSAVPAGAPNPASVRLQVGSPTVVAQQPQVVSGTGWIPEARVLLAAKNATGTEVRYRWVNADATGAFSFTVTLPRPGTWTHHLYWQPDPALPPGTPISAVTVTAVRSDKD